MGKIISIHSYRGGTGKSNITANLAWTLMQMNKRVAVVDTDIQSPGIHIIFGLQNNTPAFLLNDFLWNKCRIEEAAVKIAGETGALFLVPSSTRAGDIARIINDGYNVELLSEGFDRLVQELNLDYLLIDTHPGLNEETLLSIAVSDKLILILRPDQQDFEGSSITLRVARRLQVGGISVIINKVPAALNSDSLKQFVASEYGLPVEAVIPHDDELMVLGSKNIFSRQNPGHPVSLLFHAIAKRIISSSNE
ncbi:MAG TPA: MinD/ParA family protein [Prolixibacteraceae bacterium]|nr:MinD/ParA family protein [Prolixibacteraceae bacterium]